MARARMSVKKLADLEMALGPVARKLWKNLKASCRTAQRCPKHVTVTDEPEGCYPNDNYCAARYAVDLTSGKLLGSLHVSAGEWAMHAGSNNDQEVRDVPVNHALVTCEWNDYYRSFSMTVQVAKGMMPAQLEV